MRFSDEQIIRSVSDDLPCGVWVARAPGGEFVYANAMFAEIMGTGGRSDVAVGEYAAPYGIHTRTGELYPESEMPFVRALREGRTVVQDDIVIHRADGRRVYVRAQAQPVRTEDGSVSHVVIAFIDITREVDAELARAESEARLRHGQRMESIGRLAGGIAHDFNNMLAVIKGLAGLLLRGEADPARRADLRTIDDVTNSAVQLTRSLLGFAGRVRRRKAPLLVDHVVTSLARMFERTLDRRIELRLDLSSSRFVVADFSMLEQVVMNLVVNARDAMPGGGALLIRTRDDGDSVVLEVVDQGTGIDPSIRARIFEPYFTTKQTGSDRGTGLGLATVYGILEAHGGTIEARDGAPRGTVMRVSLPAASADAAQALDEGAAPAARGGFGLVLLVEDEEIVRGTSRRTLEALGYDVLEAAHGDEALALLRAHGDAVRAVVLDLMLPKLDGPATFAALRDLVPTVPVVVTSGLGLNDDARALIGRGASAFVEKPWSVPMLSAALADALARRAVAG